MTGAPGAEERAELGLQAERTFLAWTRSSMSFLVAGTLVLRAVLTGGGAGSRLLAGGVLLVLGGIASGFAVVGLRGEIGAGRAAPAWALRAMTGATVALAVVALAVDLVGGR